jgi:thiol:disulfide interchange protein DsbD
MGCFPDYLMPGVELRFAAFALLASSGLFAQDPVQWTLQLVPTRAMHAGDQFTAEVTARIDPAWHIYSVTQGRGGPFPTRFTFPEGQPFRITGAVTGPAPTTEMDPNFGISTETHSGSPVFRVPVQVAFEAPGERQLLIDVRYQACDESNCLPPRTDKLSVPVMLAGGGRTDSLASFLWLAMSMGALSLLTPCVFPMVPITVSYFTNRGTAGRWRALRDAGIYAFGIILTFTGLGLMLAAVFGAAGINQFASSPLVNLAIAAVFGAFAASLFGAFHFAIPSRILTSLDALSGGYGPGNVLALLAMGLTFSLTSFTCTAPFVGTLLVMASQGQRLDPVLGMLAFSTVFSAPFFVLALAPQWLSQLPRAGGWLNSVKVVMGLLEIAAAMKFLSNADLVWRWGVFTREVVLAVWIATGAMAAIYLIGWPVRRTSVPRWIAAAAFIAGTIALVPGLFGRRLGEIEAYLPPASDEQTSTSPAQSADGLHWIVNDLDAARDQARRDEKLIFVDFTGYTCTNCRWMEINLFPRNEVRTELARFVTVRLYTDGVGALYERQQKLQQQMFHTVALPLYAILRPDGTRLATFSGLTRDPVAFVAFLRPAIR